MKQNKDNRKSWLKLFRNDLLYFVCRRYRFESFVFLCAQTCNFLREVSCLFRMFFFFLPFIAYIIFWGGWLWSISVTVIDEEYSLPSSFRSRPSRSSSSLCQIFMLLLTGNLKHSFSYGRRHKRPCSELATLDTRCKRLRFTYLRNQKWLQSSLISY